MGRSPKMPSTFCCSDLGEDFLARLLEVMEREMTAFLILSIADDVPRFIRF